MGIRRNLGKRLEATVGTGTTDALRRTERNLRTALATRIAMPEPVKKPARPKARAVSRKSASGASSGSRPKTPDELARGGGKSDPFVEHPAPKMTRHEFLSELHQRLAPRTYLEVGVRDGASLQLSRTRSIGIDPAFLIDHEVRCDLQLVRATSDDFFAREEPLAHFGGDSVDLGFIDGMHLAEFAHRDFINLEPLMSPGGVIFLDDILPRNPLEAARDRKTGAWAGDVFKSVEVIARRRPDLVVLLINTAPTGTAVILNLDPASTVLAESYAADEPYLLKDDPQEPPIGFMNRSLAVDPVDLLASPIWAALVEQRDTGKPLPEELLTALREQSLKLA